MGKEALVAARTRCAKQIQDTPELLARYLAVGGLKDDLTRIAEAGEKFEALGLATSQSQASGLEATAGVLLTFAEVQREYVAVMSAVQAVLDDLQRAKADSKLLAQLSQILVNEAPTVLMPIKGQDGKSRMVRSKSQESMRAEIEKDAAALLALDDAKTALEARKVTRDRLEALRKTADSLSGKLADRAAKKGAKVSTFKAQKEAAGAQSQAWSACYRLLALVGQQDERIAALLHDGAKKP